MPSVRSAIPGKPAFDEMDVFVKAVLDEDC